VENVADHRLGGKLCAEPARDIAELHRKQLMLRTVLDALDADHRLVVQRAEERGSDLAELARARVNVN